jgi:RNA polymerase sigma-70 factor (ECF subfamily)
VAFFPEQDWCVTLHHRLLRQDPIAPAELYEVMLSPLIGWLYAKGRTTDKVLLRDAATDAILDYIKHPNKWKPDRGTLVSYICMAAHRDLLNALKKAGRHRSREISIEDVEQDELQRNVLIEYETSYAVKRFLPILDRQLASDTDRRLVALMLEGERSTDKFAKVLQIQGLPKAEKALKVKQHKDRLKKVIQRLRKRVNERQ